MLIKNELGETQNWREILFFNIVKILMKNKNNAVNVKKYICINKLK